MKTIRRIAVLLSLIIFLQAFLFSPVKAEEINLANGMEYTFATGEPTVHSYSKYTENGEVFDDDDGRLTDGLSGGNAYQSKRWLTSFRSESRLVTFDFGKEVTVSGMRAGFWHGNGYYAPRYVRLYLSNDGEAWFLAGSTGPSFPLNSTPRRYDASLDVGGYRTRFARVEFCVDIFTLCDEIEIIGSKTVTADAKTFTPDEPDEKGFCEGFPGVPYEITDIIKIYNGYYPSNQDKVNNTAEELLPYIAYLDEEGNILDTMFDAVAFVPSVSTDYAYPSGGTLVRTNKLPPAVKSDWEFYADFLFAEGYELDALDEAVGTVYESLGKEGKFPVLLCMHYPGFSSSPFGDLDGDGKPEYRRTNEDCAAIVKWYDEYLSERFASQNYEHLDFIGYYWYNEEVNSTWSADEEGYVKLANQVLHDAGKVTLYDPFYLSTGYDEWQDLGFSAAVMQPNLAFVDHRPYYDQEMLWEFAQTIENKHLGVEIETNEPSYFRGDDAALHALIYEKYLFTGYKTGYMDALHTFYQGAGPGTLYNFCHADTSSPSGKRLRRLYDITYSFVKSRYVNEPPKASLEMGTAETLSGKRVSVSLTVEDTDSLYADLSVEVLGADHGKAQVTANFKSVIYLPDKNFAGTENLTVVVSDGINPPVELALSVVVKAEDAETEWASVDPSEKSVEPESHPVPLIIGISACVLLLIAIAAFLFLKRKKR